METNIEKIVDEKIEEIMKKNGIKEDMSGYEQLYEDLKVKILKKEYNPQKNNTSQEGVTID